MTGAGPPSLGPETAAALLTTFQDAYRQELAAEEDVHRTLPFFATALGLLIAAITYVAGRLPSWAAMLRVCPGARPTLLAAEALRCMWPALAAGSLVLVASALGAAVLWCLALATKREGYDRVAAERTLLLRAEGLHAYHAAAGRAGTALDVAVLGDLRPQMLADYAIMLELNRAVTLRRRRWRAAAMTALLWSLLSIIVATIVVTVELMFDLLPGGKS